MSECPVKVSFSSSRRSVSFTLLGLRRLQEFFECFSWYEFDRLAALDLDLFASLWIDASTRLTTSTRCCARMFFNLSRAGEQFCRSLARRIRRYGKVISADATPP